jgi:hypothetical protein
MATIVKLREYKADEDGPDPISPARVLAGCGLGLLAIGAIYFFLARDYAPAAHAFGASPPASSGYSAQGTADFACMNWGHLPEGDNGSRRDLTDTDLSCPEWDGREDLKGLKAMAVYEITTPERDRQETQHLAEEIFGVKG